MKTFSFYCADTGRFTGKVRQTNRAIEDVPVEAGQSVREGSYDHLSQMIDVASGLVVDFQPPAPSADHEWIHDDEHGNRVRRWVLKPEVVQRRAAKAAALARIAELERREPRARREHEQGIVPTAEDRTAGAMTLQEIWDAIAEQRAVINSDEPNIT